MHIFVYRVKKVTEETPSPESWADLGLLDHPACPVFLAIPDLRELMDFQDRKDSRAFEEKLALTASKEWRVKREKQDYQELMATRESRVWQETSDRRVLTVSRVVLVYQDFQDWKATRECLAMMDSRVWMDSMERLVERAPSVTEDRRVCLVCLESQVSVAPKETKERQAFMARKASTEQTGSMDSKATRVNPETTCPAKTAPKDYEETKAYRAYLAVLDLW
jgi:hypothetical protein